MSKPQPDRHIKHDGAVTIAVGKSRKETAWKNKEQLWSELVNRLSHTNRTGELFAEYRKLPKPQQDQIKDVGGFVGGTLKGGRRKTEAVSWRQLITLDVDFVQGDLWGAVEIFFDFACALYSTHSHHPEKPRLRLVIPLSRPVTPDEYQAVSRRIAADFGMDMFDDTTYQPHRLMYWPSTSSDGEFVFKVQDAPWIDPDAILASYPDWSDPSFWPESSRAQTERKKSADRQGDPLAKPGIVGAFCRTYSITQALEHFLGDVYEPCGDGRYTFLGGSTSGGLILYDGDTFAFSHHGTDPISGKLVNAFDLVRLHKFGLRDDEAIDGTPTVRLPSYLAMQELAVADDVVRQTLGEERLARAAEEFGDLPEDEVDHKWLRKLKVHSKTGAILPTAPNMIIILRNDPRLKDKIALNEFSYRPVVRGDLPWRKMATSENWRDSDDSCLRNYLEKVYQITGPGKVNDALLEVMARNRFHPIREYLLALIWDDLPRIDRMLIDYLGADDTPYVWMVTRKMLVAAVARVFVPGIKFDHVLVMVGPQGIGKSYIIKLLGQQWHSDSIVTVSGKEAYEQLQGAWLIEMAELSATRKAEAEAVKHFISKQEDSYRVAYGRQISIFPRQCVFIGTTNDVTFLKDKTGNRRFWPVGVGGDKIKSLFTDMTPDEINQIWAEAVSAWQEGESLYLEPEMEAEALRMQDRHTEESEKAGLIIEYLDRRLPEDWDQKDIGERRDFIHGGDFGGASEGLIERKRVCALEVWVELFNGDPKQLSFAQAREINDILRRTPGWKMYGGKLRFGHIYGNQRAFVKENFTII